MHRFTPHPPLPRDTRISITPPRFLVPKSKLARDQKRPIVVYSMVLNSFSDSEWVTLKLPPVSSTYPSSNKQLPDLDSPSFLPVASREPVLAPCLAVVGGATAGSSMYDMGATKVVEEQVYGCEKKCHSECYPGLGGDLVCLYEYQFSGPNLQAVKLIDDTTTVNGEAIVPVVEPSDGSKAPEWEYYPVNTKASVDKVHTSKEIQGCVPPAPPPSKFGPNLVG